VIEASQKVIANLIAQEIVRGSESPTVREFTVKLLKDRGVSLYPFSLEQLNIIYEFVNKSIDYVKDINRTETLYSAERILINRFGDCDDKTILSLSMCKTLGYDVALVYADLLNAGDFQHIFGIVFLNNKAYPFDATMQNGSVGRIVSRYHRLHIMPIL